MGDDDTDINRALFKDFHGQAKSHEKNYEWTSVINVLKHALLQLTDIPEKELSIDDHRRMADVYAMMGRSNYKQDKFYDAEDNLKIAIVYFELLLVLEKSPIKRHSDQIASVKCRNRLANIYIQLRNSDAAINMQQTAIGAMKKIPDETWGDDDFRLYSILLTDCALAYEGVDDYDKAVEYYSRSIKNRREISFEKLDVHDVSSIAEASYYSADIQYDNKHYFKALRNYECVVQFLEMLLPVELESHEETNLNFAYYRIDKIKNEHLGRVPQIPLEQHSAPIETPPSQQSPRLAVR